MWFTQIIWKNLMQRRLRSALTCSGLTITVAAMIALLSVARGYERAAVDFYAAREVDIIVVRAGVAERMTSSLHANFADRLADVPGIREAAGSLSEMVSFGDGDLIGIPLHGLPSGGFALRQYAVTSGRTLERGDHLAVLLGASLASALQKSVGASVEIEGTPFDIVGIFAAPNALEANSAITLLDDLQQVMDRRGQVSEFQVRVDDSVASEAALGKVCRLIESLIDGAGQSFGLKAMPTRQFVSAGTETRLMTAMALGTSVIASVLTLLGILNTMWMSVLERTREIGVLRAVGWSRRRVMHMILGESLLLSAAGAVAGVLAAWLLVRGLGGVTVVRGFVTPELDAGAAALGAAAALLAGVLGAVYPAWSASRIPAVEALRYE
jgi:putative ABC transport system permease protein